MELFKLINGLLLSFFFTSASAMEPADKLYTNGQIYTGNSNLPWAEVVAISGKGIVYVGTHDVPKTLIGQDTIVVDLEFVKKKKVKVSGSSVG